MVCGQAGNGIDAVELAISLRPDVILMDLALPKKTGLEAIAEILKVYPQTRILIFTSFSEGEQILNAIKAGAIGYMVKDSNPQELINAVRNAHLGKPAFSSFVELSLMQQIQHKRYEGDPIEPLSDREIEILCLLARGLSDNEIAQKASITEGTVRSHVSNLLNKLRLNTRTQAVIYALRRGLINLDA
jgi:NarL family two-component system response regulator LiaR